MKVALCLSGQTRTYKDCFPSQYEQIISKYNCDVFIHTWMYNGLYHRTPDNLHYCKEYNIDNYDKYLNDNYLDFNFCSLYKPIQCLIEKPDKHYFISKAPAHNLNFFNAIMMYYSIHSCNKLKIDYENRYNFKYDIVIRCRFDLIIHQFNISDNLFLYLAPHFNYRKPFSPQMQRELKKRGISYMPNDQFAYGCSDAMNYYCDIYKNYTEKIFDYRDHAEGLLSQHLWQYNTTIWKPAIDETIQIEIKG